MTEPTTIRAELREQIEACELFLAEKPPPFYAFFARTIHRHAVVMLTLLAAMEDDLATQRDRADEWKRRYEFMETHPSYVPDPAPRGDAAVIS